MWRCQVAVKYVRLVFEVQNKFSVRIRRSLLACPGGGLDAVHRPMQVKPQLMLGELVLISQVSSKPRRTQSACCCRGEGRAPRDLLELTGQPHLLQSNRC